jgi:hypothetical protein
VVFRKNYYKNLPGYMAYGPLSGTQSFRLKFLWSCSYRALGIRTGHEKTRGSLALPPTRSVRACAASPCDGCMVHLVPGFVAYSDRPTKPSLGLRCHPSMPMLVLSGTRTHGMDICARAEGHRGAVLRVIAPDGRCMGSAPVYGARLQHTMPQSAAHLTRPPGLGRLHPATRLPAAAIPHGRRY